MEGTTKRILFVEDEPIAQTIYGNRLKRESFEVLFAGDGQVALEILSTARPDLVVLDLMLPKVSGAEVLKQIRSNESLKGIPVLILSNAYVPELTQKAMESGATGGMLKSECTPAKLVETVREMLGYISCFELSDQPLSAEAQMEAFKVAAETAMEDEMVLKKTREDFIQKTPAEVAKIRELSLAYVKVAGGPTGREPLTQLHRLVRFFATRAGMSGCNGLAILASAFEALLYESLHKPGRATPSASQTIVQTVDCLERLFQNTRLEEGELNLHAKILVVDDDAVCNLAMVAALKRTNFEAVFVEDSASVLEMASADIYDIILLDINMPGSNGFELCEKFRRMPEYSMTPIIFVTSSSDFQSRARGILSGGNDLIPKPVSPVELILKITLHLLRPHGAWAETSAVASVLKTSMRLLQNDVRDVETSSSVPSIMEEPHAPEAPPVADAADQPSEQPMESAGAVEDANPVPEKSTTGEIKEPAPEPETVADAVDDLLPPIEKGFEPAQIEPALAPSAMAEEKNEEAIAAIEPPAAATNFAPPVASLSLPNIIPFPTDSESKHQTTNMETKPKPTFDEATRGVARIIFGDDNINDMNVRLTRIALERYNVPGTQNTEEIARGVARIIFGDDKISDMNIRLTRIALDSYNITEVLGANGHKKPVENGVPQAASLS